MDDLLPPGARSITGFVNADEAQRLLAAIDSEPWRPDLKRRVQHYGWLYDYRARVVSPDMNLGPLPAWLIEVARRVGQDGRFSATPDQVIVNEYGSGPRNFIACRLRALLWSSHRLAKSWGISADGFQKALNG